MATTRSVRDHQYQGQWLDEMERYVNQLPLSHQAGTNDWRGRERDLLRLAAEGRLSLTQLPAGLDGPGNKACWLGTRLLWMQSVLEL
jgi:hypothetical protein